MDGKPEKITYYALTPPAVSAYRTVAIMQVIDDHSVGDAVRKFSMSTFVPDSVREITLSEIPTDRKFRDAWIDTGMAIEVDMAKARNIHMGRIRIARDQELARLDTEYMRADEYGNVPLKRQIALQKQALRDLPVTFDLTRATTVEELDALWPSELPAR
jgi:hypothetical protein